MTFDTQELVKIGVSIVIGGLIGAEREYRDKSAGFRTMIFICLGSAIFTSHSLAIGITRDQARIAAAVVTGVGFLGGGTIMRSGTQVTGLTTAATIWLTAALGMGIGGGYYEATFAATAAVLLVLWVFPLVEAWIDGLKTSRVYQAVVAMDGDTADAVSRVFADVGLRVAPAVRHKKGGKLLCSWFVVGSPAKHDAALARLLATEGVDELTY